MTKSAIPYFFEVVQRYGNGVSKETEVCYVGGESETLLQITNTKSIG